MKSFDMDFYIISTYWNRKVTIWVEFSETQRFLHFLPRFFSAGILGAIFGRVSWLLNWIWALQLMTVFSHHEALDWEVIFLSIRNMLTLFILEFDRLIQSNTKLLNFFLLFWFAKFIIMSEQLVLHLTQPLCSSNEIIDSIQDGRKQGLSL